MSESVQKNSFRSTITCLSCIRQTSVTESSVHRERGREGGNNAGERAVSTGQSQGEENISSGDDDKPIKNKFKEKYTERTGVLAGAVT